MTLHLDETSKQYNVWLDEPVDWDLRGTPISRRSTYLGRPVELAMDQIPFAAGHAAARKELQAAHQQAIEAAVLAERARCAGVCNSEAAAFGGVAAGPFVTDFGKHTHQAMAAGAMNCAAAIYDNTQPMPTDSKPQDARQFHKHVAGHDGWAPWTNPVHEGYLLKCCDCGLVHEMEFAVVKYRDYGSDVCEVQDDKNLRVAFRARRDAHKEAGS